MSMSSCGRAEGASFASSDPLYTARAQCEALERRVRAIASLLAYLEPAESSVFAFTELGWKSPSASQYELQRKALFADHRALVMELEGASASASRELAFAQQRRDNLALQAEQALAVVPTAFAGGAK